MGNTDVPASLAGYFYQLLLACKELVILINNHEDTSNYVAIEKGSDIKVFMKNNVCIEAKFYSDTYFTRNHKSIKHTIYNFYNDYQSHLKKGSNPNKYIYRTNVPVSNVDKHFFDLWSNKTITKYDNYIDFVKESILSDSIKRKPYSEAFNEYKKRASVQPNKKGDVSFSLYFNALLEDLKNGKENYSDFADILTYQNMIKFIDNIIFEFGTKSVTKLYSINEIYNDISTELRKHDSTLGDEDCVRIRNWFIERFFETITDSTNNGISVKDALQEVTNHKNLKIKYLEDENFIEFKQAIDESIQSFGLRIERTNHKAELDNLSNILIKFKEKFCNEIEKQSVKEVASRYVLGSYARSPHLIMDMLKKMSVVVNFSGDEIKINLDIDNLRGINNIALNNSKQFTLKGTENSDLNEYADLLIMEFIKDTQHKFLSKVDGEETVIFATKSKPCKFAKEGLNNLIIDNAQVFNNVMYQQLFMSMEYRCTECLEFGKCLEDTKASVQRFLVGGCHGGTL